MVRLIKRYCTRYIVYADTVPPLSYPKASAGRLGMKISLEHKPRYTSSTIGYEVLESVKFDTGALHLRKAYGVIAAVIKM